MQPKVHRSGRCWVPPQLDGPWHRSGTLAKQVMFLTFSTTTSNHRENHNSIIFNRRLKKERAGDVSVA